MKKYWLCFNPFCPLTQSLSCASVHIVQWKTSIGLLEAAVKRWHVFCAPGGYKVLGSHPNTHDHISSETDRLKARRKYESLRQINQCVPECETARHVKQFPMNECFQCVNTYIFQSSYLFFLLYFISVWLMTWLEKLAHQQQQQKKDAIKTAETLQEPILVHLWCVHRNKSYCYCSLHPKINKNSVHVNGVGWSKTRSEIYDKNKPDACKS